MESDFYKNKRHGYCQAGRLPLMASSDLLTGVSSVMDYVPAVIVMVVLIGMNLEGAIILFNRRNI